MVPISPQAYSAEAVIFDTKPLFDYAQKLEERRAKRALAEQEAVDKYVEQTQKNLTPTGMRSQDIPGFQKMQDEFRSLSDQYKNTKDPIKRFQLQKKGDEMFLYIQKSKEEEKKAEPARAALANLENRKKLDVPKIMEALSVHDLPLDFKGVSMLGIPQRRSINPNATYFREPSFDFIKNFNEAATGPGIKISELSTSSDGKTRTIKEGFGEPAIKSIASNFVKLVDADEDKKSYYAVRAKNLPPQTLAEYDRRVKKYFPNITVDDENWESVALAESIEEAEKRTSQKFENAPRISVSTGGTSRSGAVGQIDLTPYRDEGDSKDVSEIFQGVKVTGLPRGESMIAKKILYNKGRNEVTVTEWVGRDIEGNPTGEQKRTIPFNVFLQNIKTLNPQADFKYIETLPTAKLNAPAKEKEPAYSIKGKTYSQSQLLKMYTQDQINQALKEGTVKIKK